MGEGAPDRTIPTASRARAGVVRALLRCAIAALGFACGGPGSGGGSSQDYGLDGIEFADYCEPPLTTVRQPREEMGRTAAEILVRMIQGETLTPAESLVTLDVKLRRGASTAPPSRR